MNLFQYRTVSMLLVVTFIIVMGAERISAWLRQRIA
jgi:phosphonate transport system permease protein